MNIRIGTACEAVAARPKKKVNECNGNITPIIVSCGVERAYNSILMQLRVQIVRYVEDYFPGIVECELLDAAGSVHTFIEKGPVVSDKWPGPEDKYPMSGIIRCEILERWHDPEGRDLVRVTTEQPDYVETKNGMMEFVVLSSQVISAEETIAETERMSAAGARSATITNV